MLAGSVAISHGACLATSVVRHVHIECHVANDQGFFYFSIHLFQSPPHHVGGRLHMLHIIARHYRGEDVFERHLPDIAVERTMAAAACHAQYEATAMQFTERFYHMRERLDNHDFLVLHEYLAISGSTGFTLLSAHAKECHKGLVEPKSDRFGASLVRLHLESSFPHRVLQRLYYQPL